MIVQTTPSQQNLSSNRCQSIDLTFENIEYSVDLPCFKKIATCFAKNQEDKIQQSLRILKGVSGICKAGQITAILGPSGAGKTTLLNSIAKRIPSQKINGKITANSMDYTFEKFGKFGNYVMQKDLLLEALTVRQTLNFISDLTRDGTIEEKELQIQQLIKDLKLEQCFDTIVGGTKIKGISGGQKKRLSIAVEIITDPKVLILDQPTSGLDSLTAYIIMKYLKKLAQNQNKTIILTIHQPNKDIFLLIDRLILLAQGKIIYQGATVDTISYFSSIGYTCPQFNNPADYIMSIVHKAQKKDNKSQLFFFIEKYEKMLEPQIKQQLQKISIVQIVPRQNNVGFCAKIFALFWREMIRVYKNPKELFLKLIQTIFVSLVIGGVFFDTGRNYQGETNINSGVVRAFMGVMIYIGLDSLLTAMLNVVLVFPVERQIFLKETSSGFYGIVPYFLSRNIVQLPFLLILPMVYCLILYWMIGFQSTADHFFLLYLLLLLMRLVGNANGLFLGSVISEAKLANIFIPLYLMPLILFSGYLKNRFDLPDWIFWMEYLSPLKYFFIGLVKDQLGADNPLADSFNFQEGLTVGVVIAILIGYIIIVNMMSLFILWLKKRKLQ